MQISPAEERKPTHASTFRGDGPSPEWGRPYRDCSLAWTRISRDHPDLSARRHEIEGKGALAQPASWRQTGTLPARRPTAGIPGEPLIMPNPSSPRAPPTRVPC